jgi:hypothetical protein
MPEQLVWVAVSTNVFAPVTEFMPLMVEVLL